jgi:arginine decarboxylase
MTLVLLVEICFLAETSQITGGLDSYKLTGPRKKSTRNGKRVYSQYTYFVANGTSTANKIVMQVLVEPGNGS